MSTMTRNVSDTSVTFSLAELAKLEEERVREEERQRARARESAAREQREREARRRAEDAARAQADAEAEARRARQQAEENARREARERAELEVARFAAEARARLDADNAQRAHELEVRRARAAGGSRLLQQGLAVVLGVVLLGGGVAAIGGSRHVTELEQEAAQLREGQQALAREREHAKASELGVLDRRLAVLQGRAADRDAGEALAAAVAARSAVDVQALDHDRLRTFADALDALDARLATMDQLAALDRRRADLSAWATDRRRGEIVAAARAASVRAKATGAPAALQAYEGALDQIRDALAQSTGSGPTRTAAGHGTSAAPGGTCLPGEPGCDLDGHRIF